MNTEKLHELCVRLRPLAKKYRAALIVLLAVNGNRVFIQHFLKGFLRLCYRGWRLRLLNMQPFHHHIIR